MATIRANGWLAKWAYFMERDGVPERTTLCALFWRCALLAPIAGLMFGVLVTALSPLFLVAFIAEKCGGKGSLEAGAERIARLRAIRAMVSAKNRVCPLIEIEHQ